MLVLTTSVKSFIRTSQYYTLTVNEYGPLTK